MDGLQFSLIFLVAVITSCTPSEQQTFDPDLKEEHLLLTNEEADLVIDRHGGAYISFYLKKDSVNPLTWALTPEQMPANNQDGAPFQGHFLCLGRWGAPTEGEMEMGIPHNGEASNDWWEVTEKTASRLVMSHHSDLDGMDITRKVKLFPDVPVFSVNETVKNFTAIGRLNNIVQHVTIGPPFLSEETMVFTNAGPGFFQDHSYPDPQRFAYDWPAAKDSLGNTYNLRKSETNYNYVSTHLIKDSTGWIAAYNPGMKLLLGYAWDTGEYPWLNVWHHTEDGKPVAKGLEFGTTGIGRSYQDLLAVDTRFHRYNSFEFLDAGEEVEKSFYGFLMQVPGDTKSIQDVKYSNENLMVNLNTAFGQKAVTFSLVN